MILGIVLIGASAWAADGCTDLVPVESLNGRMDRCERLQEEVREDELALALDELELALRCVDAPVSPSQAARLHRLRAQRLNSEGRGDEVPAIFAAARRIEAAPEFREDLSLAHQAQYDAIDLTGLQLSTLPRPEGGALWLDGAETRERAAGLPAVAQYVDDRGEIAFTRYLEPEEPPPAYPGWTGEALPSLPTSPGAISPRRAWGTGRVAAVTGLGLGSAGLLTMAYLTKQQHAGAPVEEEARLETLNGLGFWGGVATGTLGLGFAVVPSLGSRR